MQEDSVFYDWLKRRRISDAIISEFNIHSDLHPIIGECIVIPVVDEIGQFAFNKYRRDPRTDIKPKYLYDKGGKVTLYGMFKAKDAPAILMTEGEMDSLVAWSANIPAVSSTGGSQSFNEEWKLLFKGKKLIICFDNDEAGGKGMAKALMLFPEASVLFLPDRPGIKDISDYATSGGDLAELLRTAMHFDSVQDVIDSRSQRLSLWQSVHFHDAYIDMNTMRELPSTTRPQHYPEDASRMARAKAYPISDIIHINRDKKASCIWHKESTPSMKYYAKDNRVYCFGCGKFGDAVDVYRQVNGCSMREAIDALNRL